MNERYEAWQRHLNAPPGMSRSEEKLHFGAILDEYAAIKRELFLDGFADFVVRQGFRAVTPGKINGKPESWQACGRRIWGETYFNGALEKAIERARSARTAFPMSEASSSQ